VLRVSVAIDVYDFCMNENASAFQSALNAAMGHALEHLSPQEELPVAPSVALEDLRGQLDLPLGDAGMDPVVVLDELVEAVRGGIADTSGGRFFGWVIGGALPAALAADWMTSVWDQNAAMYAASPAAAVVEETAGRWLKEVLRLPASASFAFVTGCQMAHVTCLAVARYAVLAARGWDVRQEGLAGAPAIRILTSTEQHSTTVRAVRLLGMGERHIETLPADDEGRLIAEGLQAALERDPGRPVIVVLQAGDVNIGAFDNFATLIPLAKKYGAWVHIDGAFGLWAAASEKHQHLLAGTELADSWTTDGHKWLNVPYDSGYAFVADSAAHRATMSHQASYIAQAAGARDQVDWTPEFSRRARGFATYAALRQLGREGVAALVERCCRHAETLVIRIGALDGAEMLWRPRINQGLVRFLDPANGAEEAEHDAYTDRVIAAILATGEALFSGTTWRGKRAMRVSVSNWQTSGEDVERVVRCVAGVLEKAGYKATETHDA
jgi:glutamate/tyrosine decarboxylase-like PLP-dependent enzyme